VPKGLLHEIDQLKLISARLGLLADQHPVMEQEILRIAANVLSTAVLLEVLAIRINPI
jgi:hypothetical protein